MFSEKKPLVCLPAGPFRGGWAPVGSPAGAALQPWKSAHGPGP